MPVLNKRPWWKAVRKKLNERQINQINELKKAALMTSGSPTNVGYGAVVDVQLLLVRYFTLPCFIVKPK